MNTRFNDLRAEMNARFDDLNRRIDDLHKRLDDWRGFVRPANDQGARR